MAKKELENFYCLSLVFNPLADSTPDIFKRENKDKKDLFSRDVLRNRMDNFYEEIIFLKTCQRIEIYVISDNSIDAFEGNVRNIYNNIFSDNYIDKIKIYKHKDAQNHLVNLITGLESFILGENEIYNQVKKLSNKYHEDTLAKDGLKDIFDKSFVIADDLINKINKSFNIKSYSQLSEILLQEKQIKPTNILILGNGLLSKELNNFWKRKKVSIAIKEFIDNSECNFYDLIINCTAITSLKDVKRCSKTFLDFSIPPILEENNDVSNYFSIRFFRDFIEENNKILKKKINNII